MQDKIKLLAKELNVGDSKRYNCPFCKVTHEKSFSVTRTPVGYLYICFRAKCNSQGIVADISFEPLKKKVFVPSIVTEPLVQVPNEIYSEYLSLYGLSFNDWDKLYRIRYAPESNRLYFPMYNPWGALIGAQLKHLDKTKQPKVMSYRYVDEPFIHFPIDPVNNYEELVVVEDYISAAVVHEIAPVCSINGTNITNNMLKLLKFIGTKSIILMLDGDATAKAIQIKKEIGPLFENFKVVVLPTEFDPKDLSFAEIEEYINA